MNKQNKTEEVSKCCGAELGYGKPSGLSTYEGLYCSNCRHPSTPSTKSEKEAHTTLVKSSNLVKTAKVNGQCKECGMINSCDCVVESPLPEVEGWEEMFRKEFYEFCLIDDAGKYPSMGKSADWWLAKMSTQDTLSTYKAQLVERIEGMEGGIITKKGEDLIFRNDVLSIINSTERT